MASPRAKCLQGLLLSKLNEVHMHPKNTIRGDHRANPPTTNNPQPPTTKPTQLTPPPQRARAIQAAQRRLEGVIRSNPRFRDGRVRVFGSALSELGTARCGWVGVGVCGWEGGWFVSSSLSSIHSGAFFLSRKDVHTHYVPIPTPPPHTIGRTWTTA